MARCGVGVLLLTLGGWLLMTAGSPACSLCPDKGALSPTFRQEAALPMARLIVHGSIANPRATGGITGQTDFHIKTILRGEQFVKGKKVLVLPRFLPINDKANPPQYLLFCDIDGDRIDPYRGVLLKSEATVDYVKKSLALDSKEVVANLEFFFRHLDDPDPEVSRDAFSEFAKTSDADIARAAPRFQADKLRTWLLDPKTPPQRLGVYAVLLGACGKPDDIQLLRNLLDSKEERYLNAADGLLAGFLQQKPREGWEKVQEILSDGRKPLLLRLAVLRAVRFQYGAQPKESLPQVLKAMRTLLVQGDLADLAIEDLRRFGIWNLTPDILALYGRKGYDSPLLKRAIVRYALVCPATDLTKKFLDQRRQEDPEMVKEVEEGLKFEKEG
jgi:hypothetical protein